MEKKPAAKKPAQTKTETTKKPAPAKAAGIVAPAADWEKIELDYRAGIKTLRQIASENGISEGAIRKRAKRDDWTRDLSERIQEKAEQLVRKEAVRSLVRTESAVTERVLVEVNAQAVADVRLSQRGHIDRALKLAMALFQELEQQTDPETLELLKDLGDFLRDENERGEDKRNDLFRRVMSLPERSKTMKQLADTLKVLVDMQRIAYGMDVKGAEQTPGATGFVPPAIRIVHVAAAPVQQEDLTDE